MKKTILLAVFLISISSILFACQSNENTNEFSANPTTKSENDNKLSIFQAIFSNAVREPGIVDMAAPEFYMNVVYDKDNQKSLYLWIGEKGQRSTFMKTEDTNTIYTVSNDVTDKLIELVETQFN